MLDMEFPCRPFVSPDFAYELEVIAFYAVFSVFRVGFEPVQAVEFIEFGCVVAVSEADLKAVSSEAIEIGAI